MHPATLRSGIRYASTASQAVAKSGASPSAAAVAASMVQTQKVQPLVDLYHSASKFPGHSNQNLIDYIDNQLLFTVHSDHRPSPRQLEQACRTAAGLPPSTEGWYSYQVDQVTKTESVARWRQITDTLCGTVRGGHAGLQTVEEMWDGIAQLEAATAPSPTSSTPGKSIGMVKEHDMDQSDIDGEGGGVGREHGGGRDDKGHDPKPKSKKSGGGQGGSGGDAAKEVDSDASSLDGEGYEVGRVGGGGKDGK